MGEMPETYPFFNIMTLIDGIYYKNEGHCSWIKSYYYDKTIFFPYLLIQEQEASFSEI
jgi:hypothetical protein